MKTLAIAVAATKSYLHAWATCVRAIAAAAAHYEKAHFILATDASKDGKAAEECAKTLLPSGWEVAVLRHDFKDDEKSYNEEAQIRIARLQGEAFAFARGKVRADLCWSVESDTIVPANSLRVLEWALAMPQADGAPLYDVAAGLYQNGLFLCGFGSERNPIFEDFAPEERNLSKRARLVWNACRERLKSPSITPKQAEKEHKRLHRFRTDHMKHYPPEGSIWEIIAKHGWRRRGWFDFAYPGIGEGAIVPSDWCGLGCTLMSRRALAHADFTGYEGRGTQDLFLCYQRWQRNGMRIAAVPHVLCDHIKRARDGKITHYRAWHETQPEFRGHIRSAAQPWVPV